jgi:hypothetical protein
MAVRHGQVQIAAPARKLVVAAACVDGIDAAQSSVVVAKQRVQPAHLHLFFLLGRKEEREEGRTEGRKEVKGRMAEGMEGGREEGRDRGWRTGEREMKGGRKGGQWTKKERKSVFCVAASKGWF